MSKHPLHDQAAILPTLYDRAGYFRQLAKEVTLTKKGDRIAVMAMVIDHREPLIVALVEELCQAAKRGVEVLLCIDSYTFLLTNRYEFKLGPLWYQGCDDINPSEFLRAQTLSSPFRESFELLESIRQAGGSYRITNAPRHAFTLPHAGRSHLKLAVVNNTVKLGGCNLEDSGDIDLMASLENTALADYLFGLTQRIIKNGHVRELLNNVDQHFTIPNPKTNQDLSAEVFIDSGMPKQSQILDEALKIIDSSQEWLFFTCQYFPGGIVGQRLTQALTRGVKVQVVFSPPSAHHYEQFGHYAFNILNRMRLPSELFAHQLPNSAPLLHAKVIANEQMVMLGSHNYTTQGVNLGTAEIALRLKSPNFSRQTVRFISKRLPEGFSSLADSFKA